MIAAKPLLLAVTLALSTLASGAMAQETRREIVEFPAGRHDMAIEGKITGGESVDYVLQATKGQNLVILLETDNPGNRFNLFAPGAEAPIFVGSSSGNQFNAKLAASGEHVVHVYLVPGADQPDQVANYRLELTFPDELANVTPTDPDFADSLSGGPDVWEVTGIREGSVLNIRAAASTTAEVVKQVGNGTLLRNKGCKLVQQDRWCAVELQDDPAVSGWAAGRFLREHVGQ